MAETEETPQQPDKAEEITEEEPDGLDASLTGLIPEPIVLDETSTTQTFDTISMPGDEANSSDSSKNFEFPKHRGRTAAKVVGAFAAIAALGYFGGVAAFSTIAMPNSTLDGKDVSLEAFSEMAKAANTDTDAYTTTISNADFELALTGSDIGLTYNDNAYASDVASQQDPWTWPLHILETHEFSSVAGAQFDETKLKASLKAALDEYNKTATQPTNASISYSESEGAFSVTPEKQGTALDLDTTLNCVKEQLSGLPASIKLDDTCLVQPSVTTSDEKLTTAVSNANTYLKADIPLILGGQSAGSITKAQIAGWIVIGDDCTATLDETKLAEWVKTNIAAKFDTTGSKRTYTRADGKVITVDAATKYWGNYYGWTTDEDTLVTKLIEAIKAGSTDTIEIPTKQTASKLPDANGRDWGNRYIDCDLSEQHVRLYDESGNLVWESDCVTGNTGLGYDTPTGVYVINSNCATGDVELRGKIDEATGEPEYISHVKYWMPFINNSYAFHDASWRSNFGSNIYSYGGSHGCVNLPTDKAAELWDLCKVGDVVVVHW